ncbi:hypothetical protein FXO38_25379 [Capsicum annuum]|nr:hypothetical protein FXO38_25379 [Capsicum annuum]
MEDERSVDSDDDFQDPPPKQINERSKKKQKVHQEFKEIRTLVRKKFKLMLKAIEQIKQQNEDKDSEPQHMDYDGVETSPQRFSLNVVQNLNENKDGIKISDDKLDEINLRDSQFTISDKLLPSLNTYWRESITTPPSATQEEPTDEHLNEKKSESIVDLVMGDQIMTPPKIQELSTDEQRNEPVCPDSQSTISDELLPSLNANSSKSIIKIDVGFNYLRKKSKYDPNRSYKFSTVDCNFMNIIRSVHDVYSVDDPNLTAEGQKAHLNEYISGFRMHASGLWRLYGCIAEYLSYGHKVFPTDFDPNALCTRYVVLLWDYGIQKQDANVHSDVESPLRPARQSRITSVTEVFDV